MPDKRGQIKVARAARGRLPSPCRLVRPAVRMRGRPSHAGGRSALGRRGPRHRQSAGGCSAVQPDAGGFGSKPGGSGCSAAAADQSHVQQRGPGLRWLTTARRRPRSAYRRPACDRRHGWLVGAADGYARVHSAGSARCATCEPAEPRVCRRLRAHTECPHSQLRAVPSVPGLPRGQLATPGDVWRPGRMEV